MRLEPRDSGASAMNRRRRVVLVCVLGSGRRNRRAPARSARPAPTRSTFLAAGLVLGELLVVASRRRRRAPALVRGAGRARVVVQHCASTRSRCSARSWSRSCSGSPTATAPGALTIFGVRMAVAAATYAAYQGAWHLVGQREEVAAGAVRAGGGRGSRSSSSMSPRARCSGSARRSRRAAASRGWRSRRRAC